MVKIIINIIYRFSPSTVKHIFGYSGYLIATKKGKR